MQFIQFKNAFRDFPVISLADIRGLDRNFDRRRLSEWREKGYIRKIIKGYYIFTDADLDDNRLAAIANRIYRPSYISLETALSRYHLIPENVYQVTSVSTRRTSFFESPVGRFSYRTVKPEFFFGYTLQPGGYKLARVEKAILDYFYLNPDLRDEDDFASLRMDRRELQRLLNRKRLTEYLGRFDKKNLARRVKLFLRWLDHA